MKREPAIALLIDDPETMVGYLTFPMSIRIFVKVFITSSANKNASWRPAIPKDSDNQPSSPQNPSPLTYEPMRLNDWSNFDTK
jgi:hypothetical protein